MKVLQVINSLYIGGAEKLVVDSVPLYQKRGIEMDVLTLDNTKTSFSNVLEKESSGKLIGLSAKSVYNPFLIIKIIPYLKKYHIIHAHLFPTLYWVILAKVFSFSKTKIIYTEHSTNNRRRNIFIFQLFDKLIYNSLSKIVTISKEVDVEIKSHLGFSNDSFNLIQNGVSIDFFQNSIGYSKSDFFGVKDFIIIQVSSFRWQKDQATLIRAISILPKNVKLILVGAGPLENDCKKLAQNLNVNERIKFLGLRDDISKLLKTADAVVLSSVYEGFGLAIVEGMAASKPAIASNVSGLQEIISGHGILFEQGNEQDLAEKIQSLIDDPDYSAKVAAKCYQRAQEFDINRMVDQYVELYEKILNDTL